MYMHIIMCASLINRDFIAPIQFKRAGEFFSDDARLARLNLSSLLAAQV